MSNLSDLLNPAPNPDAGAPSKVQQLVPLKIDGRDYGPNTFQSGYGQMQSPIHHIVTSPGLEVLATAASNTAPLFSPNQEHSSIIQAMRENVAVKDTMSADDEALLAATERQDSSGPQQQHRHKSGRDQIMHDYTMDSGKTLLSPYKSIPTGDQDSGIDESSPSFPIPQDLSDTMQIPEPAPSKSPPLTDSNSPLQAEHIHIKAESGQTPDAEMRENSSTLIQSSTPVQRDSTPGTPLKMVISNTSPVPTSRNEDSSVVSQKTKTGLPKKRAAPKKGTAAKPPSKRRKLETGSGKASPRTGTPATSRASATPVPKKGKQESATPTRSLSVANGDDDEDDGELELFCICRKPDDHTVMIGCDGPCEDWFHTRCVNMTNEKVALISKWFCPNCAAEGHETEWKRMCRLDGCSKPARVEGPHRSKYCCNEHGREYMASHLFLNERKASTTNNIRRRRRDNYTDHFGNEIDEEDEYDDNRGGILRPGELKALVDGVNDVATFRKLGNGVLSPPETAATSPQRDTGARIPYSPEELTVLEGIAQKRTEIEVRKRMLDDRATLVHMVDLRRKNVLTKLKEKEKSLKDICGYDARLAWSDEELNEWRTSQNGQEQLQNRLLHADPKLVEKQEQDGEDVEVGLGVCKKKRCERHRTWFKIQQADLAMEKEEVRQRLRKLDEEEKGLKELAMIRSLEGLQAGGE